MKRLVFVNSNTKVAKVKSFMKMKGIEKYTLLESSQDFREELLVNSADIFIFDFYGDIQIIESLMDFVDHVNDMFVYAESTRIGKMYSRLSPNIWVLPDDVDMLMHFWEMQACTLNNVMLCDSCSKPPLHVREPEGLITKTKRMQILIDQSHIPVHYMDTLGKLHKGKASQIQMTLKPRGLFTRPEGMIRHQPKFGEKVEVPVQEFRPLPVAPKLPPSPAPKPAPIPKPPKPVKPPKPIKVPAPVVVPEPIVEIIPKPIPVPVVVKPPKIKMEKQPKIVAPTEPETQFAKVNMEGAADKVVIEDEFDNRMTLLDEKDTLDGPTSKELGSSILSVLDKLTPSDTKVVVDPAKDVVVVATVVSTQTADELAETGRLAEDERLEALRLEEEAAKRQKILDEENARIAEPEEEEETAVQETAEEIYSEPEPKRGLFGGMFGGSGDKKSKKKKKGGFFEQTDVEWGSSGELVTESVSYSAQAFRSRIITQMDEYMVANSFITSDQRAEIQDVCNTRKMNSGKDVKFGDVALELGIVKEEVYCDIIAGFRNIEVLHWLSLKGLPVVVDRFDRESYGRERFFETSQADDGRVRIIASVNSTAIDEKIRKYAENCIIQYTIDSYVSQKLLELDL